MSLSRRSLTRQGLAWGAAAALGLPACSSAPPSAPGPAGQNRAPDEVLLGRDKGYPVGTARTWFYDESVRVGSFSAMAEIPGIANGGVHRLEAAAQPMALPQAARPPDYRWRLAAGASMSVEDYLQRQRVMGLMVIQDGVVQLERYQYERNARHRFVSHSMAKSITALSVGYALAEGRIASLAQRAADHVPELRGTLLGETTLRDLLHMASGARYSEEYTGRDDAARVGEVLARSGIVAAVREVRDREVPAGTRFSYASINTQLLSVVMQRATGSSLSSYLTPRLWQAIGAQDSALWRTDRNGVEMAGGAFNATLRDYGRLASVLAHDGRRPDQKDRGPLLPPEFLLEATDWHRQAPAFHPGKATPYYGYGLHFWLFPGERRRFALLGVYGQMIFVDPQLRLAMVQTSANATAKTGQTSLAREADAFWRGLVNHYGPW